MTTLPAQWCVSIPGDGIDQTHLLPFELGCGRRYAIVHASAAQVAALLGQLPAPPSTTYIPADGGLISNLRVGDNISLLALYHSNSPPEQFEAPIASILSNCGYENAAAEQLLAKLPADLSVFERRLVSFTRAALLAPVVMVYESLWSGLSDRELELVSRFDTILRNYCKNATLIYLHSGTTIPFDIAFHQTFIL